MNPTIDDSPTLTAGRLELRSRQHTEAGRRIRERQFHPCWCSLEEQDEWAFVARRTGPYGKVDCRVPMRCLERVVGAPTGNLELTLSGFGPGGTEMHILRFPGVAEKEEWTKVLGEKIGSAAEEETVRKASLLPDGTGTLLKNTPSQKEASLAVERAGWRRKELGRCIVPMILVKAAAHQHINLSFESQTDSDTVPGAVVSDLGQLKTKLRVGD